MTSHKIVTCFWFNSNGEEAAKFYTSLFFILQTINLKLLSESHVDYFWSILHFGLLSF